MLVATALQRTTCHWAILIMEATQIAENIRERPFGPLLLQLIFYIALPTSWYRGGAIERDSGTLLDLSIMAGNGKGYKSCIHSCGRQLSKQYFNSISYDRSEQRPKFSTEVLQGSVFFMSCQRKRSLSSSPSRPSMLPTLLE
jgi:hypothetical protein